MILYALCDKNYFGRTCALVLQHSLQLYRLLRKSVRKLIGKIGRENILNLKHKFRRIFTKSLSKNIVVKVKLLCILLQGQMYSLSGAVPL